MSVSMRFPVALDSSGRIATDISDAAGEAGRDSSRIKFAIGTKIGERVMMARYGNDVLKAYYQNGESVHEAISESIKDTFAKWLTPLTLVGITYTVSGDGSVHTADISWVRPKAGANTAQTASVDVSGAVSQLEDE